MVLLTLALLSFAAVDPSLRRSLVDPGPLSAAHAQAAEACSDCHSADQGGLAQWGASALSKLGARSGDPHADDRRCLSCHDDMGPDALSPHGVSPASLARVTTRSGTLAQLSARSLLGAPGQVACAECHVEHKGRQVTLTRIADETCQSCHQEQFGSFAHGHPEFSQGFGERAAGRVRFDHVAHLGLGVLPDESARFAKGGQRSADCTECHRNDAEGRHVVLRDHVFERWCASCHSGSELAPLEVFNFPAAPVAWIGSATLPAWSLQLEREPDLDVESTQPTRFQRALLLEPREGPSALRKLSLRFQDYALDAIEDEALAAGEWDGTISEAMRLEVAEDQAAALVAAREEVRWREPARAYLRDTADLLRELGGPGGLKARWTKLAPTSSQAPGKSLWPRELILRAQSAWLRPRKFPLDAKRSQPGAGTWIAKGTQLSYRDYPHADPFLRDWLERAADLPPGSKRLALHLRVLEGRCDSCHRTPPEAPEITWRLGWGAGERPTSRFDHGAHASQVADCRSCHQAREELAGHGDFALANYATRQDCASCHTPAQAGQSCVQCHSYHHSR